MPTFRIACNWSVYGTMFVEADTLDKAKRKARDLEPLPTEAIHLHTSFFNINEEITEHFYNEDYPPSKHKLITKR